jgi:CheY-like chemotaxis protein
VKDRKLLVLDDDPHIGRMVQLIAESVGFSVRFTASITEFFLSLDSWEPTHVAIDLVMPEMDGAQVLQQLGSLRCTAAIIIISRGVGPRALDSARLSAAGHGLEILGTLAKPFSPQTLRTLLTGA